MPLTGWSRDHGDLRVAHFVGLHAIQVLPLIAIALRRWRRPENVRVKAILAASASYGSLFLLLLGQALRGQSVVAAGQLPALGMWAMGTMLVLGWIAAGSRRDVRRADWVTP